MAQSASLGLGAFDGGRQLLVVSSEDDTVGLANGDPAGGFECLGRLVDEEGREVVVGQHPVGSPHKRAGHDTCFVEKSGVDLHLQFGGSATKVRESVAQAVALGSASLAQGLLRLADSLADAPQLGVERMRLEAALVGEREHFVVHASGIANAQYGNAPIDQFL